MGRAGAQFSTFKFAVLIQYVLGGAQPPESVTTTSFDGDPAEGGATGRGWGPKPRPGSSLKGKTAKRRQAEMGVTLPQQGAARASGHQKLPEAERDLPQRLQSVALPTPWSGPSGLQKSRRMHSCFVKTLGQHYFVKETPKSNA